MKVDILERLHDNQLWLHRDGFKTSADNARDAASEIAALRAEITELKRQLDETIAVLKPFAALIADHHDKMPDDQPLFFINSNGFTVGDLRKANAAIKGVQSCVAKSRATTNLHWRLS